MGEQLVYPRLLAEVDGDQIFVILRGAGHSELATTSGMGWAYSEVEASPSTALRNNLLKAPGRLLYLHRGTGGLPATGGP